ncbi:HNH endonuclease domain-containing protein [Algoriphagus hitonicola]|uniref:HNH endonuclease n=1 Tax=Algoriphagus hitonicola TaxID=435880 RepID=A0A1I2VZS1_9BACT|nr:HNH endonuclease domain-containing protein [Algoriphagus hitonicola]SFG94512.1 HNH endonuclease [Algoriphagus hitonicola]
MMFNLPEERNLPIQFLSSTLGKTAATYKFYWFISLVQLIEEEGAIVEKKKIFARMLANAWYTVNYFKISFGKQDKVHEAVSYFKEEIKIPIDLGRTRVWEKILSSKDSRSNSILSHFDNQVPHWFLSPWFPRMSKRQIYSNSKDPKRKSPYFLESNFIEVNPEWLSYLLKNSAILKDFCFWNLSLFLQKHNPNVPDIPNKLIKPISRASLNKQKRDFWNIYFEEVKEQECIYSGENLTSKNYVLDHFVPYNFVSHDLNWNLVPAHASINGSKSDKLPRLNQYFDSFYEIQKRALQVVIKNHPASKLIEDYLSIFPSIESFQYTGLSKNKFKETIEPLITIAHNNGFEFYEPKAK